MWFSAICNAVCAWASPSLVGVSEFSNVTISSALSTSTSAMTIFSSTSDTSLCAAHRWSQSDLTVFSGFSLFCASCSCCWSLPSSVLALSLTVSKNLLVLASLALRKMRASPMAACASLADCSVSASACLTMSVSSPQDVIISDVITVFSTMSSAVLVFSMASGSSSSSTFVSLSSAALFLASVSAFVLALFMPVTSLVMFWCVSFSLLPRSWNDLMVSPTADFWASATLRPSSRTACT
mmetsp:Transcript_78809/g.178035  ORF Transcript_78809/g.178035 Transcript_78809/m.178035 type:complete len:239 (+) Transcript_78809:1663-2379(+)